LGAWNSHKPGEGVLSLDWCRDSQHVLCSSTANGQISVWDRRSGTGKPALWTWGASHNQGIASVAWNPIQHSLIASGDKASAVRVWDVRSLNRHVVQLAPHKAEVYHVAWCPYNKFLLASAGKDKRLFMYDLRRSGLTADVQVGGGGQGGGDGGVESLSKLLEELGSKAVGNRVESTCAEMVFAHAGHTACIPEFDWCPSGDLTMISTDMDGIVQCWQPPQGMLNTFAWVLNCKEHVVAEDADASSNSHSGLQTAAHK